MENYEDDAVRRRAACDQGMQFILEYLPAFCWGMHRRLIEQGFSENQALPLTRDAMYLMFNQRRTGDA